MRFSRSAGFTLALTSLSLAAPAVAQQRPGPAAESATASVILADE